MNTASQTTLIKLIEKEFPIALPVPLNDFDSTRNGEGIWFRGSEDFDQDGQRIYDSWGPVEVHPKLEQLLTSNGWYAQPYDCGTLLAYPIS